MKIEIEDIEEEIFFNLKNNRKKIIERRWTNGKEKFSN